MLKTLLPLLILFLGTVSCVQSENSNSQDADTYSDIGGHAGFAQVRAILRQNCANCHVYHTMTEDEMIAQGVLKLGDAANSAIYFRLSGSTAGGGPKSMPVGGSLSVADLSTIEAWITNAN
jgi:uncharacterized membrane protein